MHVFCIFVFAPVQRKLSMFHMERRSRNKLIILIIIINWATNRNWQTQATDTWKVTQLNLLRQENVKTCKSRGYPARCLASQGQR